MGTYYASDNRPRGSDSSMETDSRKSTMMTHRGTGMTETTGHNCQLSRSNTDIMTTMDTNIMVEMNIHKQHATYSHMYTTIARMRRLWTTWSPGNWLQ